MSANNGSALSSRSARSAHSVHSYVSETSEVSSVREEDLSMLLTLLENPKQRELGCSFSEASDFRAEFSRKMVLVDPNAKQPKSRGKWQDKPYPLPWTEKIIEERKLYDPDYKVYFPLRPFGYSLKVDDMVVPPYKIAKIETRFKHCLILTSKFFHSILINGATEDGFVYSIGDAEYGKLGDGYEDLPDKKAQFVRRPILVMDRAVDIAVGKHHSAIVTDEGNVHTFGYGKYGQLGHSNFKNENIPRVVEDFINRDIKITKVACGDHHTLCLTDTGLVYGFGNGSQGQIGVLGFLDINRDLSQVEKSQLKYVCRPRLVEIMRETQQETEEYRRLRTKKTFVEIDSIICGSDYSAFLGKHGQLWLCGCGMTGVIANGTFVANNYRPTEAQFSVSEKVMEKYVKVDISLEPGKSSEDINVKVDLSLQGKLIQPPIPNFLPYCHEKPTSACSTKSSSRASSSAHWLRYVLPNQFNVEGQTIKLVEVSCGASHIFCMSVDQRVFAAGLNFNGQLGIGNKTSQCRLVEVTNLLPHAIVSEGIKQIICGTNYTVIINGMGTGFATGRFPGNGEDCTKFTEITSISQRQYRIERMFSRNPEHIFILCRKE